MLQNALQNRHAVFAWYLEGSESLAVTTCCKSCAGHYVTQDVQADYLALLERSTRTKERALADKTREQETESLSAAAR